MNNSNKKIVAVLLETPDLAHFVKLLKEYNLIDALNSKGPFTVFAPTNDAFNKTKNLFSRLTAEEIAHVLKHHVVSGSYAFDKLPHELTTLEGTSIQASSIVTVKKDIKAANGIIHIIRDVLVPD